MNAPKNINTNTYYFVSMNTQISLKLSKQMLTKAKQHTKTHGYDSVQDLVRELLRRKLYEEPVSGANTAKASEVSLAKEWLTKEEEDAWAHLQKET